MLAEEMSDPETPLRGVVRKHADLTPSSDTGSPDSWKRSCLESADLQELKSWFSGQLDSLRVVFKSDNEDLRAEIAGLNRKLDAKDKIINDIENNLVMLSNELEKDRAAATTKQDKLSEELKETRAIVNSRDERISDLERKAEEAQQYSRRYSLRITGLFPFLNDNYRQLVVDLARDMAIDVSLSDIDRAHPAGKDRKQLIVRFTNYSARFAMYSNRRKLKDIRRNVYINEDLTAQRYELFRRLLELKKGNKINNCWSLDGRLFAFCNGSKVLVKDAAGIDALSGRCFVG
jgi:cell division septum initiation protein DivIVA